MNSGKEQKQIFWQNFLYAWLMFYLWLKQAPPDRLNFLFYRFLSLNGLTAVAVTSLILYVDDSLKVHICGSGRHHNNDLPCRGTFFFHICWPLRVNNYYRLVMHFCCAIPGKEMSIMPP